MEDKWWKILGIGQAVLVFAWYIAMRITLNDSAITNPFAILVMLLSSIIGGTTVWYYYYGKNVDVERLEKRITELEKKIKSEQNKKGRRKRGD